MIAPLVTGPRRTRPLRLLAISAALLAAGAALSVLSAFAVAVLVGPPRVMEHGRVAFVPGPFTHAGESFAGTAWTAGELTRPGALTISWMYAPTPRSDDERVPAPRPHSREMAWFLGRRWADPALDAVHPEPRAQTRIQAAHAFGAPMPCLWYGEAFNPGVRPGPGWRATNYGTLYGAAPVPAFLKRFAPNGGGSTALPTRPLWVPLTINAAVWAALLGGLTLGLGAARRTLRRLRGRCPACGYDLSATPAGAPCPECGAAR